VEQLMHDTVRVVCWRISGHVQGVGFRWFVSRAARSMGLDGWVQNTEKGDVLVLARGEETGLARLLDEIREGPPGARVDDIAELDQMPSAPPASPFSIVRQRHVDSGAN
jgi:acylphosphatase